MWILSALRSKRIMAARAGWSRKQVLDEQERRFRVASGDESIADGRVSVNVGTG